MLDWSIEQNEHPVAIHIPSNGVISDERKVDTDYNNINKFKVEEKGEKVAIIALGDFYQLGEEVSKELKEKLNIIEKAFYDRYDVNELLKENRITKEQIVEDVEKML